MIWLFIRGNHFPIAREFAPDLIRDLKDGINMYRYLGFTKVESFNGIVKLSLDGRTGEVMSNELISALQKELDK